MAHGAVLVGAAFEDAGVHEGGEAVREDVASDPEPALEVVEATDPEERLAEHQKRPALADDAEALGDRARHLVEAFAGHRPSLAGLSCEMQRIGIRSVAMHYPPSHRSLT